MIDTILSYPKVQDDAWVSGKDFCKNLVTNTDLVSETEDVITDFDYASGIGLPTTKDTVFRKLFDDKQELLNLYNAMNNTSYTDTSLLEISTLDNAIYMNVKNDLSFILDCRLNLYEHQSTFNPNMPMRNLIYVCCQFLKYLGDASLYSSKLHTLPAPKFVVFYNGVATQPDKQVMRLSDSYQLKLPESEIELELKITMYNVNEGHNLGLMNKCRDLYEYAVYVGKLRKCSQLYPVKKAVEMAVDECINEGILKQFLQS